MQATSNRTGVLPLILSFLIIGAIFYIIFLQTQPGKDFNSGFIYAFDNERANTLPGDKTSVYKAGYTSSVILQDNPLTGWIFNIRGDLRPVTN